jgi:hypothetical protein
VCFAVSSSISFTPTAPINGLFSDAPKAPCFKLVGLCVAPSILQANRGYIDLRGPTTHQAPITVQVFAAVSQLPHGKAVMMVVADVLTALLLGGLAAGVQRRELADQTVKLASM